MGQSKSIIQTDISSTDVTACVERILASSQFRDSPQLSSFLRFIVDETLAGRGHELKGYSIATLALSRPDSFDPQTDPIVRVQAGRLRQALMDYYAGNADETIGINLVKGQYAPRFERRHSVGSKRSDRSVPTPFAQSGTADSKLHDEMQSSLDSADISAEHVLSAVRPGGQVPAAGSSAAGIWKPIAIMLMASYMIILLGFFFLPRIGFGATRYAAFERFIPMMTVDIEPGTGTNPDLEVMVLRTREAIARFDDIVVVRNSGDIAPTGSSASGKVFHLHLRGLQTEDGKIRYNAKLIDTEDLTLLWSREYDPVPVGIAGADDRLSIIQAVSSTIAQPYGMIHAHVRSRIQSGSLRDDPYGCLIAGFDYWRTNDSKTHAAARQCLMLRIQDYPNIGALHAQLAYLHIEEYRMGYNPMPGDPLERAFKSAMTALAVAPVSARSYQALMAVHFSRGEAAAGWQAAMEATIRNPYDTEIIADIGARYVQNGEPQKGYDLLEKALKLNPAPPTWAATFRAVALYLLDRREESSKVIFSVQGSDYPPALIGLVMVAKFLRSEATAIRVLNYFRQQHPKIADDPRPYLSKLAFTPVILDRIFKDYTSSKDWITSLNH